MTVPVAKILKYFPPMPATCTPGSPGPPEVVSCGPRECGSHLQLPLESGHLATQGRHLGAVRGCRPALQRLFKTDDLLGELRDLQRGGGSAAALGPQRGAAVRAAGQACDNNGHILAAGELRPAGRPRYALSHSWGRSKRSKEECYFMIRGGQTRVTLHARPVCEHVASGSGGDGGAEPSTLPLGP